jgi:uncharacterized protein
MVDISFASTHSRRSLLAGLAAVSLLPTAARATPAAAGSKLIAAARLQLGVTLVYDPAYTRLDYPGGDVARSKGVCTDVVIRAYRDGLQRDLQALVNADMRQAFASYPKRWGLRKADANIDHRRVPNLQTFLQRQGAALPVNRQPDSWQAGDIFTSLIGGRLPHIGLVSDKRGRSGAPMILHNIGNGAREDDALFDHPLTGHFRWL